MATTTELYELLDPVLQGSEVTSDIQGRVKEFYDELMSKLEESVDDMDIDGAKFDFSGLFPVDQKEAAGSAKKYQKIQDQLLKKLTKQLTGSKAIDINNTGVSFNDVMGMSPRDPKSLIITRKYERLRKQLSKLVEKGMPTGMAFGDKISVADILGGEDKKSGGFLGNIRNKISGLVDNMKLGGEDGDEGNDEGPRVFEEEPQPVALVNINDDTMHSLSKVLGASKVAKSTEPSKEEEEVPGFIGPILLVLGGLGALAAGIMGNGPAKGIITMISKGGLMLGLKMAAKGVGKILAKTLKWIPFVGTLVDIADAYFRFADKDYVGGTIALVGGLASLVNLVAPGVGTALSLGASALNAFLDFKAGGSGEGKNAAKMDLIKSFIKPIFDKIKPVLEALPIIGFGMGLWKIAKGDVKEGFETFAKSLSWIPGIGPPIAKFASFLGEKAQKFTEEKFGTDKPLWESVKDYVVEKVKAAWGNILMLGEGIKDIFTGDIPGGFSKVVSVLSKLPKIGPPLVKIANFLQSKAEVATAVQSDGSQKSLWEAIKDGIKEKVEKALKRVILFGRGLWMIFSSSDSDGFRKGWALMVEAVGDVPVIGKPLQVINGWLNEADEAVEASEEGGGKKKSLFQAFKDIVYEKIKKGLGSLPWWLKKVMSYIPGLKDMIDPADTTDPDDGETFDDVPLDDGDYKRLKKLQERRDNNELGKGLFSTEKGDREDLQALEERLAAQKTISAGDFAGSIKSGTQVGTYQGNPVVSNANDFIIGAKDGGPIEKKLSELVKSVNDNMNALSEQISNSIVAGMSQIQPIVVNSGGGGGGGSTPAIAPGKAPSYEVSKIYNQRAKFYALYGGS